MLIKLSQASVIVPVITGLCFYTRLNKPFKFMLWFFVLSGIVEILSSLMMKSAHRNNMPLLHIYTVLEFFAFGLAYYLYFKKEDRVKYIAVCVLVLFLIVALVDAVWINGIMAPNTVSRSLEGIVLVLLSLNYYFLFFKESGERMVWKQPMFWLSAGVLFYFGVNAPFFMVYAIFIKHNNDITQLGLYIHSAINIFTNILFSISFLCFQRKKY